jgi:hypothetical protein
MMGTMLKQMGRPEEAPPGAALCAGDWVEVKSKEEILASLDDQGRLEGMPFMPEMLKYCGGRFKVYKRAHKTCDYSKGMVSRRVPSAVHLEGLRCTGDAHGNCQAECLLFWKEAWLRPLGRHGQDTAPSPAGDGCTEAHLHAATLTSSEPEPVYSCQATTILGFSTALQPSELDQYVEAYTSGNYKLPRMIAPLLFRVYERLVRSRLGRTGIPQGVYDAFQKVRGGVPYPNRPGHIPSDQKTPVGEKLNLQPGDVVRVKSFQAILATINREGLNRGLLFSQELVPYCGGVFRVHSRVSRIIDERNGKMLHFKNDCIILEDVICQARYNAGLSFCPRSNYPYWREIWLERAGPDERPADNPLRVSCGPPAGPPGPAPDHRSM